jgi:hypothetical protein
MFGNDLFTGMPEWLKKKRLMEEGIDKKTYDAGNTMLYDVHKNQDTMFSSVSPHGMGVKPVYGTSVGVSPSEDFSSLRSRQDQEQSMNETMAIGAQRNAPSIIGYSPTNTASALNTIQPTNAVSDAPKRDLDFTSYSKSLDKSFMMAALQSAIPEDQPAPSGISGGGAHGGGNNLADMQPFLTGERRKKKNPALWRYS